MHGGNESTRSEKIAILLFSLVHISSLCKLLLCLSLPTRFQSYLAPLELIHTPVQCFLTLLGTTTALPPEQDILSSNKGAPIYSPKTLRCLLTMTTGSQRLVATFSGAPQLSLRSLVHPPGSDLMGEERGYQDQTQDD